MADDSNSAETKPQLYFADKVDNSHSPFVPKLRDKPFAKRPKSKDLEDAQRNPQIYFQDPSRPRVFGNPYDFEIASLAAPPSLLEPPVAPDKQQQTDLVFADIAQIDSVDTLNEMVESLRNEPELAIDLEHHSRRSYQGFTCLVQISSRTRDYVVDCLALRSHLHVLNQLTTDQRILKVFHGSSSDIDWLQKDFGVSVVNLLDTFVISKCLHNLRSRSLGSLLSEFCDVYVDKSLQTCDWRRRPLTKPQIEYAASDTHYLLGLKDLLLAQLHKQTRATGEDFRSVMQRVYDQCKNLARKGYKKPAVYGRHFEILRNEVVVLVGSDAGFGVRLFDYLWKKRDDLARKYDESLSFVMSNRSLLDLVRQRREFEAKLHALERKRAVNFSKEFLSGFHSQRENFWGGAEIEEEEPNAQRESQAVGQRAYRVAGEGRFVEDDREDSRTVVDRNLKNILNMKIRFELEMRKDSVQTGAANCEAGPNLSDFLFFGVNQDNWREKEEAPEEADQRGEQLQIEQSEQVNETGKEDFLEFDDKQLKRQKNRQTSNQELIDRIESVNLPENLKMKLMKSVVGKDPRN